MKAVLPILLQSLADSELSLALCRNKTEHLLTVAISEFLAFIR